MIFKLPVKKIMVGKPVVISRDAYVSDAIAMMKVHQFSCLFVVDKDKRYVGVFTDVDVVKKGLGSGVDPSLIKIEEIMSRPIVTIDEDESIEKANELMSRYHIRHLLVTSEETPVGVISARDLFDPHYEEKGGVPFFPHHFLKEVIAVFVMLGILFTLVIYSPAPMEPKADPFTTPEHIKPEWYFLAAYQLLKVAEGLSVISQGAPKTVGVLVQGIFILFLFLLPFIDHGTERHPKRRPVAVTLGITGILLFIIFTVWGYLS